VTEVGEGNDRNGKVRRKKVKRLVECMYSPFKATLSWQVLR